MIPIHTLLLAWMSLRGVGVVGEAAGIGFGNASVIAEDGFLITRTGLGTVEYPSAKDFVHMQLIGEASARVHPDAPNPSSDIMMHEWAYRAAPNNVGAVLHLHHPGLYERAPRASHEIGTKGLGEELAGLLEASPKDYVIRSVPGHEPGLVAIATLAPVAVETILRMVERL